jgi:hypothetical protein
LIIEETPQTIWGFLFACNHSDGRASKSMEVAMRMSIGLLAVCAISAGLGALFACPALAQTTQPTLRPPDQEFSLRQTPESSVFALPPIPRLVPPRRLPLEPRLRLIPPPNDQARANWIPRSFNGMTFYLIPCCEP